jgi:hypothetical protein
MSPISLSHCVFKFFSLALTLICSAKFGDRENGFGGVGRARGKSGVGDRGVVWVGPRVLSQPHYSRLQDHCCCSPCRPTPISLSSNQSITSLLLLLLLLRCLSRQAPHELWLWSSTCVPMVPSSSLYRRLGMCLAILTPWLTMPELEVSLFKVISHIRMECMGTCKACFVSLCAT